MKDPEIRQLLWHHSLAAVTATGGIVVPELVLEGGRGRVDIASITADSFTGYEIKSDHDTMARVTAQLKRYVDVFDHIWFVCGPKYRKELLERLPEFVGLLCIQGDHLEEARPARPNPMRRLRPVTMLLLVPELRMLIAETGVPGTPRRKHEMVTALIRHLSFDAISSVLRRTLAQRMSDRGRVMKPTVLEEPTEPRTGRQLVTPPPNTVSTRRSRGGARRRRFR